MISLKGGGLPATFRLLWHRFAKGATGLQRVRCASRTCLSSHKTEGSLQIFTAKCSSTRHLSISGTGLDICNKWIECPEIVSTSVRPTKWGGSKGIWDNYVTWSIHSYHSRSRKLHSGTPTCKSVMSPAFAENAEEVDFVNEPESHSSVPGIIVKDRQELDRKLKAMKDAGLGKLQVIADFDMTLTKFLVNGARGQSCHALVKTENEDINEKRRHVHLKYYPMEIDPKIPYEKKLPLMEEWWATSHSLILEGGLSIQDIQRSVAGANIGLRARTSDLFKLLEDCGVPVLIFSAGLADIIEEVLSQKLDDVYKNVRVVSNRMQFDKSGRLVGFKGRVMHVLNKNEHALEMAVPGHNSSSGLEQNGPAEALRQDLHKRTNVILLGDHLGDLRMSDGVQCDNRITVGFLNDNVESQLEAYTAAFDIVVLDDGPMDVVLDLVQAMA